MADEKQALEMFLGDWHAEGTSFAPDGTPSRWVSNHSARWHSGDFFIVQDERANGPFDTLSFLGWDPARGSYFSWSIENHGFAREYLVTLKGRRWTFAGEAERATVEFSEDGTTQSWRWEYCPEGPWIPLCNRTATRIR